jgi:hypothetical protein
MDLPREFLMNRHQVIGLSSRLGELPLEKLIKGLQILDTPILPSPHLTEITAEINEAPVTLRFHRSFP